MTKNINYFHSLLKPELDLTQKYVKSFSESNDKLTNKAIRHIVNNKGKMLRPIFLILAGRYSFCNSNKDKNSEIFFIEDIAKAAAILELVQMSSLIHDDVLDHSSTRRNKATLNSLKGNRFAILMGDYLVAQSLKNCYQLVHHAERIFDSDIMYLFLESISKLILGEIQQNNFNEIVESKNDEVKNYFEIVENKTASLFSLACCVGAKIGSNNAEHAEVLKQLGHHIGIAYQITDDLRDFAFTKDIAEEKNFQDIKFGIKTLPVIFATKFSHNGEREKIAGLFNSKKEILEVDKIEILNILERSGSIQKCIGEARAHIVKAKILLYELPENHYSILLLELINYLSEIGDKVIDDISSCTQN
ncbi:MAG: polyprenyl synthetase family protein [Segetibacter sp.]|nr:polyprenyl synthetase family protein [Segetibacter sp.]